MTIKTEELVKAAVRFALKSNCNSTTSLFCFQPKAPAMLKKFSKVDNDK